MSNVIINHIRNNHLFVDVDIESLQLSEENLDFTSLEPGKFVFKKGDIANRIYLLAYGKVILFSDSDQLKLNDNSFFGAELLNSDTYEYSAVVEESSLLLSLTRDNFLPLIEKDETLKEHLTNWKSFTVSQNIELEPENEIDNNDDLLTRDIETDLGFDESDFTSENNSFIKKTGKDNSEISELISSVYYEPTKKIKETFQKLKETESNTEKDTAITELSELIQTLENASNNAKLFSQINNELQFHKVNLGDLLSELAEEINAKYFASLELNAPEECSLNLSRNDFFEAIKQVVINSLESIDEGGTVKISVIYSDDYTEILVEDNGCGIPGESVNDIFEPFFSFGKQNHIGLGLAIADKIISAHSGKIAVKKTSDVGTIFSILLPLPE